MQKQENIYKNTESFPWHRSWSIALIGLVIATVLYRYALPTRDGDIWFHLLYGQYFLDHKTLIPDHTIFSWTPSSNGYIYCTWLSDIFLYLLYKTGGLAGLFTFRYACIFTLVLGCFLFAKKQKIVTHPLTWLVCLLATLMSYTAIAEKPEILSFLFMTLCCWNWWHIRVNGDKSWKNCYIFPMLMLVWVNSHGGFVFGCIFLLVAWVGEILNTWLSPTYVLTTRLRKHLFTALLLAALSILCTPYGYHYPLQYVQEFFLSNNSITLDSTIASYQSPFAVVDTYGFAICANLAVFILFLILIAGFRRIEWSLLLLNITFIGFYSLFFRTTFYWVPVFLFSSLYLLPEFSHFLKKIRFGNYYSASLPLIVTLLSYGLSAIFLFKSLATPELHLWMGFGHSRISAVKEVEYIKNNFPDSRIGNTYDPGSYLLWELWPRNKVFLDARFFPYHSWVKDALAFENGKNIDEFVSKQSCDLWCISFTARPALMWFYSSPKWQLAFYGNSAAVFVKEGIELPKDTPYSSSELLDLKNPVNALTLLTWVVNIKDWENADKILHSMQNTFTFPAEKKMVEDATLFTRAAKAYANQKYAEAVYWFDRTTHFAIKNDKLYAYALIHLSIEAWQNSNGVLARQYNQKAWKLYPGYYVNIYNAAIMNWSDWEQAQATGKAETKKETLLKERWETQLLEFIKITQGVKAIAPYVEVAQQLLDHQHPPKPLLMKPAPHL